MIRPQPLPLLLLLLALATSAPAADNSGFAVTIDGGSRVTNPVPGQKLPVTVRAAGTTRVKGVLVRLLYDPAVLEVADVTAGDITADPQLLPWAPHLRDDGLAEIEAGSTLIGRDVSQPTTGGVLATVLFTVTDSVGDAGSAVWLLYAEVNTAAADSTRDTRRFAPGELGVSLVQRFVNRAYNLDITRGVADASFTWESRFGGLGDTVRVRAIGDSLWRLATHAMTDSVDAGRSRRHVVTVDGLVADTAYEYVARSHSLDGKPSNRLAGVFRTRRQLDLRPTLGSDLDVQATTTTVAASWYTNRPADTKLRITDATGAWLALISLDPDGAHVHAANAGGLTPDTEYIFTVFSRLVGADDLIGAGLLRASDAAVVKSGTFRTAAEDRPLRLLGPPAYSAGTERAVLEVRANQITLATVAYGEVGGEGAVDGDEPYPHQVGGGELLRDHHLTLSGLQPATEYRYRVRLLAPDGDSLSTDPGGDHQWSRDHRLLTTAAADTLPPVIVAGPTVVARDVLAVIRFRTDVDTRATVFFGTRGETYGTTDEFETTDQTPDGRVRLSQEHAVTIGGLTPGTAYDYGILVETTNGQTASFEPNLPAGKMARAGKPLAILQPPGGAGSFVASSEPDTRLPVLLSGPTVSSKTHETAVVEWQTDEPATSQVDFGVEAPGAAPGAARETSGHNETRHRMVLSNLSPGTRYAYTVGSTDAAGNGVTRSATAVFSTDPEIDLAAPAFTRTPRVVYRNHEAATIAWTTDEDATVEVAFGTEPTALDLRRRRSTTGRLHEITLTNLAPATTYHYRACAVDLSGNGPTRSGVLSFTTDAGADDTAPVVTDVRVAVSDSSAIVAWRTDEPADSFVDVGTLSGLLDLLTVGDGSDVTEHAVTLPDLRPGTTYFYAVGSTDRAGNGPTRSAEHTVTTADAADLEPPVAPANLIATAGSRQVKLLWSANTELDLAGYNVYRRAVDADAVFSAVATHLRDTTYADLGLTDDDAFEYRVTAIDRRTPPNESAPAEAVATPTAAAAPTAPSRLSTGESLTPTLTFVNATPAHASGELTYTIQMSTRPDYGDVTAATDGLRETPGLLETPGTTSWTIPRALVDGHIYYWRVRAVEAGVAGPYGRTAFRASDLVSVRGDFDRSGTVGFEDFFLFVAAFGRRAAAVPAYDLDGSGGDSRIGYDDFFRFAEIFDTSSSKTGATPERYPADSAARLHLELGVADGPTGGDGELRLLVVADAVHALRAFGLLVTFDTRATQFLGAGAGELLQGGSGETRLFGVLAERPGQVWIGGGHADGAAMSGAGSLAELRFRQHRVAVDGSSLDRATGAAAATGFFELRQALLAGSVDDVHRAGPVAPIRLRPAALRLGDAYPNPFNPVTHIDFALAADAPLRLEVFDILGRRVRTLRRAPGVLPAGYYTAAWDGRDDDGAAVGNGVYFYRLWTPAVTRTGKVMVLK